MSLLDIYRSWLDSLPVPFNKPQSKFYKDTMADSIESMFMLEGMSLYMIATEYGGIQILLVKLNQTSPEGSNVLIDEAYSFRTENDLNDLFNKILQKFKPRRI